MKALGFLFAFPAVASYTDCMNSPFLLPSSVCHVHGTEPGPRVVVFGGTHGDETMGVQVVHNILEALGSPEGAPTGQITSTFVKGDLFLGIGNPEAVALGKRSVSGIRDLNRCFHETFFSSPEALRIPDQQRAAELKDLLASADYFFDLHSVTAKETIPFVGLTTFSPRHAEVCRSIPVHHILDVQAILGQDVGLAIAELTQTPTTCSWVNRHGGVGLAYEMGYQEDAASVPSATAVIVNLLVKVGVVHGRLREILKVDREQIDSVPDQRVYRLVHCERNRFHGFHYAHPRYTQSFASVKAGELIGQYEDGEKVCATHEGLLAFPAGEQTLTNNQSLFYLAVPVS
ncbi:succinylglutamate desuccinylase/aspartoacylase family protein [Candidatus Uhrbacteria bacterium]|nr:succinylglutamate desuccinylase/aspartoacylase family protein [Candidatus Uhrbacteria bacterium]